MVDVLDPDPLCICRFSRSARRVYRSPALSASPIEFVQAFAEEIRRHCGLAISPLLAFERLQSKLRFVELAIELGLPYAPTQRVDSVSCFPLGRIFPYYVKTAYGTAGDGTWRVDTAADRGHVLAALKQRELDGNLGSFLVQDLLPGTLEVVQSVFDQGELVAAIASRSPPSEAVQVGALA